MGKYKQVTLPKFEELAAPVEPSYDHRLEITVVVPSRDTQKVIDAVLGIAGSLDVKVEVLPNF